MLVLTGKDSGNADISYVPRKDFRFMHDYPGQGMHGAVV